MGVSTIIDRSQMLQSNLDPIERLNKTQGRATSSETGFTFGIFRKTKTNAHLSFLQTK